MKVPTTDEMNGHFDSTEQMVRRDERMTMKLSLRNCLLWTGFWLTYLSTTCWSWTHPTLPASWKATSTGTLTGTRPITTCSPCFFQQVNSARSAASFDFSAPSEWEYFYQESSEVLEWHSSIPLERIASYVPTLENAEILMVGCGNSRLPATILSSCNAKNPKIVLLDTSQTCLDQLEQEYGSSVEYVCGNAVALDRLFPNRQFDMVLDKGLSDALFCSEGWNGPIQKLFESTAKILRSDGQYLLVSYKLPQSTKDFLEEIGDTVGLDWQFDLKEDSNERVGVSLATKSMVG